MQRIAKEYGELRLLSTAFPLERGKEPNPLPIWSAPSSRLAFPRLAS